jgi:hypothetical protein
LVRQKSNSAQCSRLSPGFHTSGGRLSPCRCPSTQPHILHVVLRRPWSFYD